MDVAGRILSRLGLAAARPPRALALALLSLIVAFAGAAGYLGLRMLEEKHALLTLDTANEAAWGQEHVAQIGLEFALTYGVLLGSGTLLLLYLFFQNRWAARLADQAEAARRESERAERRLHDAIESMSEGFLLLDADLRVVMANERYFELLPPELRRLAPNEDYRRQIRAAAELGCYGTDMPPDQAADRRLEQLLHPGDALELVNPDGTHMLVREYPTAEGGRVSLRLDVTSLRRAEREQLELQAQFYRAQKMEALGRLAGGIAHDFNNVLMSIQGYAEFLREDLQVGTPERDYAEKILRGSERAAALVRQILDFGRQSGSLRKPVRLDEVVREAVDLLAATLPKAVRIELDHTGRPVQVSADAAQIGQVLMNLCVNARDAIGERRGTIRLVLRSLTTDGGRADRLADPGRGEAAGNVPMAVEEGTDGRNRLWVGLLPPARYHAIDVIDDGAGMDRATLERIFDPFYSTKPQDYGSGLGLAAVHGIVLAHGGALAVETAKGAGTRFSVFLPAESPDVEPACDPATLRVQAPELSGRILVVDDEPEVADVVALGLRRLGSLQVETAASAEAALQRLRQAPDIDLVLSDQIMPVTCGIELLHQVRRQWPTLPVILMTGFAEQFDENTAVAAGACALLRKPVEGPLLRRAVEQALHSGANAG